MDILSSVLLSLSETYQPNLPLDLDRPFKYDLRSLLNVCQCLWLFHKRKGYFQHIYSPNDNDVIKTVITSMREKL